MYEVQSVKVTSVNDESSRAPRAEKFVCIISRFASRIFLLEYFFSFITAIYMCSAWYQTPTFPP